jgi:hypothetical protein
VQLADADYQTAAVMADHGEKNNLAAQHPEKKLRLASAG